MEHESFENEEVAKIMNANFVNIKVDREENPGVDKLYMTYVQLTSGGGGWPMSVFLTPDLYPFFGATYFPPEDRFGKPGFKTLLTRIAQIWIAQPEKVKSSGKNVLDQLKTYIEAKPAASSKEIDTWAAAAETFHHFETSFDDRYGGFGGAPKFPTPVQLQFLLDYYSYMRNDPEKSKDAQKALDMTLFTLKKIAAGGIHDHVGSGFHRYSTDQIWHVPHFEKMLYDQAQLLSVYAAAYQITKEQCYADVARDIVLYVSRDLQHSEGGFYSAEDADSYPTDRSAKKLEGAFCVWEYEELNEILGADVASLFSYHYDVKDTGNVDPAQDPHNELRKKNVLMEVHTVEETAKAFDVAVDQVQKILSDARTKLWNHRSTKRPKPHRDDKILTPWNGLMISGLAQAYQVLGDQEMLDLALRAAQFICRELYREDTKTLLRSYRNGPSNIQGFVDDYRCVARIWINNIEKEFPSRSYFIQGLLDLYEATFDEKWIVLAHDLQARQNELFYDSKEFGYFNVAESDKNILVRLKEEQDGAEPSANAVSVKNLWRLGTLLDVDDYLKKATETVKSFDLALSKFPFALPALLAGLMLITKGLKEVLLAGNIKDTDMEVLKKITGQAFVPNKVLVRAKEGVLSQKNGTIGRIVAANHEEPTIYICENSTCGLPFHDLQQLRESLA
ncbi:Spermatoproteinsis-associated protein 20 [Apophysomyces ossiformis]|uniref:Spermatoproteinsis-associated protein 20 n=1 Tax=Apophysomyces ossiformis TaxID=679940 RepID=A0A8H7EMZ1_9FUNG|nr:Spermatoproteinsis-associated protein 20 [Apophysomyces ossiformis]